MLRTRTLALLLIVPIAFAACRRDPKEYAARGDKYAAARQYREAVVEYRNALQREPRMGEVRFKLAEAYRAWATRRTPTANTSAPRTCCPTIRRRRSRRAS